ncbi:MAG: metal-dependent hydrolase [Candidatus Bilamarchaeaceae archaeon]
MNWPQHLLIGFLTGVILSLFFTFDFFYSALLVVVCALSALVPDIDHKDSKIRQLSNFTALLLSFLLPLIINIHEIDDVFIIVVLQKILFQALAMFGAYSIVMLFLIPRHRGFVHSIVFSIIYAFILLVFFNFYFAVFGTAGFLSHLLADKEIKLT